MALRDKLKKLRMELWRAEQGPWCYIGLHTPWGVVRLSLQPPQERTPLSATWGKDQYLVGPFGGMH